MGKPRKNSRSGSTKANAQEHGSDSHPDKNQAATDPLGDDQSSQDKTMQDKSSQSVTQSSSGFDVASDKQWEHSDLDFGSENPQTCCSHCQTIFEVSVELLSSNDTRVRCGECLSIFDALANLRDGETDEEDILVDADGNVIESNAPATQIKRHEKDSLSGSQAYHEVSSLPNAGAAALAGLANDTSSLDVTYSDFDLFSDEADLPEVAYFDQTRDTASFDLNELEDDDEMFSDTLFTQDATVDSKFGNRIAADAHELQEIALTSDVDYITDESPPEPLIFNYRERETRTSSNDTSAAVPLSIGNDADRPIYNGVDRDLYNDHQLSVPDDKGSPWLVRSALLFLVLSLAGGLYVYRERDSLYTNQLIRPVLETACSVLNCVLPEQSDLSAIKVQKRAVFSHPSIENALIINLGFVNEAGFNQRYPILEIRLTDRSGRLVVKNNFLPTDYLDTWREGDMLDAGKRLDISLTVEDPGNTATSFELDFR